MTIATAKYAQPENLSIEVHYSDGAVKWVPTDPANIDFAELLAWAAVGGVIAAADVPAPKPEPIVLDDLITHLEQTDGTLRAALQSIADARVAGS
jgi:hypothetical protein